MKKILVFTDNNAEIFSLNRLMISIFVSFIFHLLIILFLHKETDNKKNDLTNYIVEMKIEPSKKNDPKKIEEIKHEEIQKNDKAEVIKNEKIEPDKLPKVVKPTYTSNNQENTTTKAIGGLSPNSFSQEGIVNNNDLAFQAGNTTMVEPSNTNTDVKEVLPLAPVPSQEKVVPSTQKTVSVVDIENLSTEPKLIKKPNPVDVFNADYPVEAKEQNIEGVTKIKLLIDKTGKVIQVKAIKGHPLLKKAAEELAIHFYYKPATKNGEAVSVWWYEEIPFRINN